MTGFLAICAVSMTGAAWSQTKAAAATTVLVAELYKTKCATCHMADGNSAIEMMNFADGKWKHGTTQKQLAAVIREGVPGTAMVSFKNQLSEQEIQALAKYIRGFDKKLKARK